MKVKSQGTSRGSTIARKARRLTADPGEGAGVRLLRYGGRKSGKFVRCYKKEELSVFRVEVELHSSLLRHHDIARVGDLPTIEDFVYPGHIRFVGLDWTKLNCYLARKMGSGGGREVLIQAQKRATSIRWVARYLRRHGVKNVHRFLVPLEMNREIEQALRAWALSFDRKEVRWVRTK